MKYLEIVLKRILMIILVFIFFFLCIALCIPGFIFFGADKCEDYANKMTEILENLSE